MESFFTYVGKPQITFAIGSQMDENTYKLNIDCIELRLRNVNGTGNRVFADTIIPSSRLKSCIEKAARTTDRLHKSHENGGLRIACVAHSGDGRRVYKYNAAEAHVKILATGKVNLFSGASEISCEAT
jgi:CO/xanthine dehydrogenase Mo-binding subunit